MNPFLLPDANPHILITNHTEQPDFTPIPLELLDKDRGEDNTDTSHSCDYTLKNFILTILISYCIIGRPVFYCI